MTKRSPADIMERKKGGSLTEFCNLLLNEIRGVVRYRPQLSTWRATNRKDHFIGIQLSGSTRHKLNASHVNLSPSSVYFFNQKDDFTALAEESGESFSIHFTTREPISTPSFCLPTEHPEEFIRLLTRLEKEWHTQGENCLPALKLFYEFCALLWEHHCQPYSPKDRRITLAKEYFDLHFKEEDCLAQGAELSQLSRRRFNEVFRTRYSCTPHRYLLKKRLRFAEELLSLSPLAIREIALQSGFGDVYHFSKAFKAHTGISPGEYRKQARG